MRIMTTWRGSWLGLVSVWAGVAALVAIDAACSSSDGGGAAAPDAGGDASPLTPPPPGTTPPPAPGPDASTDAGDAGADADADAATCPVGALCDGTYNYAFITSTQQSVTTIGGVAGADALCDARALAAGLPGTYVAWISSSTSNAKDRLGTASGWVRTDRRPFAASAEDPYASKLLYPLNLDETGALAPADPIATATEPDGTVATEHCLDWTSVSGADHAYGGYPFIGSMRWSIGSYFTCNDPTRVYCLGKDHATPLPSSAVPGRLAFLTKIAFQPETGLAAADAECQTEATAQSLPGTYKALLGTSSASPISRFSTSGPTWVRLDGAAIWATAADAAANGPVLAPILFASDGARISTAYTWIGSTALNVAGTDTCGDWSDGTSAKMGSIGVADMAGPSPTWIETAFACDTGIVSRVACLQE
jgi:hypothetical protein